MALTFEKTAGRACSNAAEVDLSQAATKTADMPISEALVYIENAIASNELSYSSDDYGYKVTYGPNNTSSIGDVSSAGNTGAGDWNFSTTYPAGESLVIKAQPGTWTLGSGNWATAGSSYHESLNVSEVREKLARLEQLEKEMETLKKVFSWLFNDEEEQKP